MALDLQPGAAWAMLALAGAAFLWLALGLPLPRPRGTGGGAPAPAFPPEDLARWPRPDALGSGLAAEEAKELLGGQLRHPTAETDLHDLPPAMRAALLALGAAVARPDRVDAATARLLDRAARCPGASLPDRLPDAAALEAVEAAAREHAWWDCVAVELMARARAAGSWASPHDLRFLAAAEPALLAALSAGPGGTVSPDGAGILAHHAAERAAKTGIPAPFTKPALAHLFPMLTAEDRA